MPKPPANVPLFGSHLSIAGSMTNALREAESLGLRTVQVFTKNQQQWKAPPLKDDAVDEWLSELKRLGWEDRTVSHASYLINLASPDPELWKKSVDLMTEEIERCDRLSIRYLVHHPGSYKSWTLDEGLARIAEAYRELFKRTPKASVVSCLENTAGGGSLIGGRFEQLARLRDLILESTDTLKKGSFKERLGFCIDTCHAHAAGYDMSTPAKANAALDEFDRVCGLAHIKVLHLNDSKGKAGSHLDRHQHIGEGEIGEGGFSAVLARSGLSDVPMILETPKGVVPEGEAKGEPWDTVNLRRLYALLPGRPTPPPPPSAAPESVARKTTPSKKPARRPAAKTTASAASTRKTTPRSTK